MNKVKVFFLLSFSCFNVQAMQRQYVNIFYAAQAGDVRAVQTFLDAGMPIDQEDVLGRTALICAAEFGHEQVVRLLLAHGASVNHVNMYGSTALVWAACNGYASCCRVLMDYLFKIPSDRQRRNLYTFLMCMKRYGLDHNMRQYIKPYLLSIIEQENREEPEDSVALREIQKINRSDVKHKLMKKYWPNYKQSCVVQ